MAPALKAFKVYTNKRKPKSSTNYSIRFVKEDSFEKLLAPKVQHIFSSSSEYTDTSSKLLDSGSLTTKPSLINKHKQTFEPSDSSLYERTCSSEEKKKRNINVTGKIDAIVPKSKTADHRPGVFHSLNEDSMKSSSLSNSKDSVCWDSVGKVSANKQENENGINSATFVSSTPMVSVGITERINPFIGSPIKATSSSSERKDCAVRNLAANFSSLGLPTMDDLGSNKLVSPVSDDPSNEVPQTEHQKIACSSFPIDVDSTSSVQIDAVSSSSAKIVIDSPAHSQSVVESPRSSRSEVYSPAHSQSVVESPRSSRSEVCSPAHSQSVVESPRSSRSEVYSPAHSQSVVESPRSSRSEVYSPAELQCVVERSRTEVNPSILSPYVVESSVCAPSDPKSLNSSVHRSLGESLSTSSPEMFYGFPSMNLSSELFIGFSEGRKELSPEKIDKFSQLKFQRKSFPRKKLIRRKTYAFEHSTLISSSFETSNARKSKVIDNLDELPVVQVASPITAISEPICGCDVENPEASNTPDSAKVTNPELDISCSTEPSVGASEPIEDSLPSTEPLISSKNSPSKNESPRTQAEESSHSQTSSPLDKRQIEISPNTPLRKPSSLLLDSPLSKSVLSNTARVSNGNDNDDDRSRSSIEKQLENPIQNLYSQFVCADLDTLHEKCEEYFEEQTSDNRGLPTDGSSPRSSKSGSATPSKGAILRRKSRNSNEKSPTGRNSLVRPSVIPELNMVIEESSDNEPLNTEKSVLAPLDQFVLLPGKRYRRSLLIIRHLDEDDKDGLPTPTSGKGSNFQKSVGEIIALQANCDDLISQANVLRKSICSRRTSLMRQCTPPPRRRSRFSNIHETSNNARNHISILSSSLTPASIPESSTHSTPLSQSRFHTPFSKFQIPQYNTPFRSPLGSTCSLPNASPMDDSVYLEEDYERCVMMLCQQNNPCSFSDILDTSCYEGSMKVGEGVYGEVFVITRPERKTVLKIMPIEGNFLVNGEKQKKYEEIFSELLIARKLSSLRNIDDNNQSMTSGFCELINSWIVRGKYPDYFLTLWKEFDATKGSDNDNPKMFGDKQLFLVLEFANGGTDLESYSFSTAKQALSLFKQVVLSLAVAESAFEFEHRDLHWGNVLVSRTKERNIINILDGEEFSIPSNGVKATIIDFTLSRMSYPPLDPIFNNLGLDPELFVATGDYQFEVYRLMKKDVGNNWSCFVPKTNVRWLHYLVDKMLTKVKYQRKTVKVHKDCIRILKQINNWIESKDSSIAVAYELS